MNNSTVLNVCRHEHDDDFKMSIHFWLNGVTCFSTSALGIIGNVLSIFILCKKEMSTVFNKLLMFLCLADLLFLMCSFVISLPVTLEFGLPESVYLVLQCLCHLALTTSVFMTASCTIERHQAVCLPHVYRERLIQTGKSWLVTYYVLPTLLSAACLNIPRFISVTSMGLELQKNPIYLRFLIMYQCFHPIFTTVLCPFLLLTILNFRIYRRYLSFGFTIAQGKDVQMTRILLTVVLTFLLLNLPRLILGIFEISRFRVVVLCVLSSYNYSVPEWQWVMDQVARYLVVLNSSINFIIYCLAGKQFRCVLLATFFSRQESPVLRQI